MLKSPVRKILPKGTYDGVSSSESSDPVAKAGGPASPAALEEQEVAGRTDNAADFDDVIRYNCLDGVNEISYVIVKNCCLDEMVTAEFLEERRRALGRRSASVPARERPSMTGEGECGHGGIVDAGEK